jgi:acyl carrier protein
MELTVNFNFRLVEAIADKAELGSSELPFDATLEELGLDSLSLMEIAIVLQRECGVVIAEGDLRIDQTVDEAIAYLNERTR